MEHEVSVTEPPVSPVGLDDTSHLVNKEQIVVQYLVLGLHEKIELLGGVVKVYSKSVGNNRVTSPYF